MTKLDRMIREVHEEIWFRQKVFPRQVAKNQMDQEKADYRLNLMIEIKDLLEDLRRHLQPDEQR